MKNEARAIIKKLKIDMIKAVKVNIGKLEKRMLVKVGIRNKMRV
jgi:hypothetical protein